MRPRVVLALPMARFRAAATRSLAEYARRALVERLSHDAFTKPPSRNSEQNLTGSMVDPSVSRDIYD